MITTTEQFAKLQGCDYQTAVGLIRYLKEKGLVKERGKQPNIIGKGRMKIIYDIPDNITLSFNQPIIKTVEMAVPEPVPLPNLSVVAVLPCQAAEVTPAALVNESNESLAA